LQWLAQITGAEDATSWGVALLNNACERLTPTTSSTTATATPTHESTAAVAKRRARSCLMDMGDEEDPTQSQADDGGQPSRAAMAKVDLDAFLLLTDISPKCAALAFWMENKGNFPNFSLVKFSGLGAVRTTAESERDCSTAGNIIMDNQSMMLT